jgi:hypothetical protein
MACSYSSTYLESLGEESVEPRRGQPGQHRELMSPFSLSLSLSLCQLKILSLKKIIIEEIEDKTLFKIRG